MSSRPVRRELGGAHVLVNNAGIYPIMPIAEVNPDIVDRIMRVNVHGVLYMTKAFAAQVERQGGGGAVVNIASIDGIHPSFVGLSTYGASKGAVVAMTKHHALELAPLRIRVNAVAPGAIMTEGAAKTSEGGGLTEEERQGLGRLDDRTDRRRPHGRTRRHRQGRGVPRVVRRRLRDRPDDRHRRRPAPQLRLVVGGACSDAPSQGSPAGTDVAAQHDAGDVRGFVRCQVEHRVRHLFGAAEALQVETLRVSRPRRTAWVASHASIGAVAVGPGVTAFARMP